MSSSRDRLAVAFALGDDSVGQVWCDYLALGGSASRSQVIAHVFEDWALPSREHDLLALALNEALVELDLPPLAAYTGERP